MEQSLTVEAAAALLAAQGVAPERPAPAAAEFATRMLRQSDAAFSRLAFEDEPSGYPAALRRHAP